MLSSLYLNQLKCKSVADTSSIGTSGPLYNSFEVGFLWWCVSFGCLVRGHYSCGAWGHRPCKVTKEFLLYSKVRLPANPLLWLLLFHSFFFILPRQIWHLILLVIVKDQSSHFVLNICIKQTNLWKFELNWSSNCETRKKKDPCNTKMCAFRCLISRPQI